MTRFRRMHTLQKFSAVHASFHNHFGTERHLTGRGPDEGPPLRRLGGVADARRLAHSGVGEPCA